MPSISAFYGIVVYMYFMDTNNISYRIFTSSIRGDEVIVSIPDGKTLEGSIPASRMKLLLYDCSRILDFGVFEELKNIDYSPKTKVSPMSESCSTEPLPPWIEYPDSDPIRGGWRQGVSETWLQDVWLPFWRSITPEARTALSA